MSNRTILEFNHDYCPNLTDAQAVREWAEGIIIHLRTGDRPSLPQGVTFKHMRHHSEPDPLGAAAPSLPSHCLTKLNGNRECECSDRYRTVAQYQCSCGFVGCHECTASHLIKLHLAALSSDKVSKEVERG